MKTKRYESTLNLTANTWNRGRCFQRQPTNDSLYFSNGCLPLTEFLGSCTDLRSGFPLNTGERRNCRSVNLSPRRSFLLGWEYNWELVQYKTLSSSLQEWLWYPNVPVQRGLLVVHHHGAAPLASGDRGGASAIRRVLAIGCRGHIGHITQTQAPPCCPYTKPTCGNVKEDVTREREKETEVVCLSVRDQRTECNRDDA